VSFQPRQREGARGVPAAGGGAAGALAGASSGVVVVEASAGEPGAGTPGRRTLQCVYTKMTAILTALYARISEDRHDGAGVNHQLQDCRALAQRKA
jgi:hypothetical protein